MSDKIALVSLSFATVELGFKVKNKQKKKPYFLFFFFKPVISQLVTAFVWSFSLRFFSCHLL